MKRARIIITGCAVYDEAGFKGDMFDCEIASRGYPENRGSQSNLKDYFSKLFETQTNSFSFADPYAADLFHSAEGTPRIIAAPSPAQRLCRRLPGASSRG